MRTAELPGDDPYEIRLTLPALAPYARVARLAMTGLATRSGFSYDEVEDLRIAVGEVFGMLVPAEEHGGAVAGAAVRFACRLDDDDLRIEASAVPPAPLPEVGELSALILAAIVDEATIDQPGGRIVVRKRTGGVP